MSESAQLSDENGDALSTENYISLTVMHNRMKHLLSLDSSKTILHVKQLLEPLTHVPVHMQKLIYRGILSDQTKLVDLNLSVKDAKLMLVGTQLSEAEKLRNSEASIKNQVIIDESPCVSSDWSEQEVHKKVIESYGKPENAQVGILNVVDILPPDECLVGLCDKQGQHLRLRIKPDSGELWLTTAAVTHKFSLSTIHDVISQPIKNNPEYHIMAFQLGPTPKSRYFVYWLPSQYVECIKTMVLQYKIINSYKVNSD